MRIIAGSARRVELAVAEGSTTRPFLELARGALFNSLGDSVTGAKVLDLYAGSGALGLEAVSRGARACAFVERDRRAITALKDNIANCGFGKRTRIIQSDVLTAAGSPDIARIAWDIIFVDPPFPDANAWARDGGGAELMQTLSKILAPDGMILLRVEELKGRSRDPEDGAWQWDGLQLLRQDVYGRSRICRYRL